MTDKKTNRTKATQAKSIKKPKSKETPAKLTSSKASKTTPKKQAAAKPTSKASSKRKKTTQPTNKVPKPTGSLQPPPFPIAKAKANIISSSFSIMNEATNSFEGKIFVATPLIDAGPFAKSVIYICTHDEEGTIGVVINRIISKIQWSKVLEQLDIHISEQPDNLLPVHFGGPIEADKGFIIHSAEYTHDAMFSLHNNIAITPNVNLLHDILNGIGPKESLFVLGHAAWVPGQLEEEIKKNYWLTLPADPDLIFHTDNAYKWNKAIKSLGINWYQFSNDTGHA